MRSTLEINIVISGQKNSNKKELLLPSSSLSRFECLTHTRKLETLESQFPNPSLFLYLNPANPIIQKKNPQSQESPESCEEDRKKLLAKLFGFGISRREAKSLKF